MGLSKQVLSRSTSGQDALQTQGNNGCGCWCPARDEVSVRFTDAVASGEATEPTTDRTGQSAPGCFGSGCGWSRDRCR